MQTLFQERRQATPLTSVSGPADLPARRFWLAGVLSRSTRRKRADQEALVASSAKVVAGAAGTKARDVIRQRQTWQLRSFDYYDLVPEIWYAAQFYSRHMSKVELLAQRWDREKAEWVDAPDSPAQEFLDTIKDKNGDRATLVGTYGRLRFLTGECYMVQLAPETDEESWEVLSMLELEPTDDGKKFKRKPSDAADDEEELRQAPDDMDSVEPDDALQMVRVWRLWRRHPKRSKQADSPMRAVQDVCEELLLLTLAVRAQARSRIARSGIMKVPSEISPPPTKPKPGEAPLEDPFLKALAEHMEAPLTDEGSAAQLVPMLVRGPAAYLDKLTQLQLHVTGADYPEASLRSEAIDRLANGLDMPREALVGISGTNHWNAWMIDEDTWVAHVQPVVEEMCGEWTAALLRPALDDTDETPDEWRIWYNPAAAVNHPDRGKDATDAFDRGELNGEALREAKGFGEDDAPSDAERARFIGIKTRDSVLAMTGKPALKAGSTEASVPAGAPGDDSNPGDETGPGETAPSGGGTGNDVNMGPPTGQEGQARLLGAAEAGVYACRKAAGSRIMAKAPRNMRGRFEMVPRHQLFAAVGMEALAQLNGGTLTDPYDLVRGGTDAFEHTLEAWGYPPERVQALAEVIRCHAADTLHQAEPDALPPIIMNL